MSHELCGYVVDMFYPLMNYLIKSLWSYGDRDPGQYWSHNLNLINNGVLWHSSETNWTWSTQYQFVKCVGKYPRKINPLSPTGQWVKPTCPIMTSPDAYYDVIWSMLCPTWHKKWDQQVDHLSNCFNVERENVSLQHRTLTLNQYIQ